MTHLSQLLIQVCSLAITIATADTTECNNQMDLVFVVDSSGSICNDTERMCDSWKSLRNFMHKTVNNMVIGENDVCVALVQFATYATIKWHLTTYKDKSSLLNAIDNLPYNGGNTNTIAALDLLTTVFSPQYGDRADVRNTAIMITDGKPAMNGIPYPMDQIRSAVKKVNEQKVRLLTVGVTESIDMVTLKELSSPPHTINETVFVAENYQHLWKVLKQLEIQTCRAILGRLIPKDVIQCNNQMDLVFVVDSSGSICNDTERMCDSWRSLRHFMHDICKDMTIGENDVRVALVQFASDAKVIWNLLTHKDKASLLNAIDNLPYNGGNTNTIAALNLLTTVFSPQYGDRASVGNTAIMITDGKPALNGIPYPMDQIRSAVKKVNEQKVRLLTVGVTESIDMVTLKELSSPPNKVNETVFVAANYQNLKAVLRQLVIQTCKTVTIQEPSPQ